MQDLWLIIILIFIKEDLAQFHPSHCVGLESNLRMGGSGGEMSLLHASPRLMHIGFCAVRRILDPSKKAVTSSTRGLQLATPQLVIW